MEGLQQERTRLRTRRARNLHARILAPREGEGVPRHATLGHLASGCAGGGSTAFSGDRAPRARRKAVDAPEASDPGVAGAPAPVPKHNDSLVSWQSLAVVCARVTAELGRRRPMPALAAGERLRRQLAAAGLPTQAGPPPLLYAWHRTTRADL
jgi:hypothetical protein